MASMRFRNFGGIYQFVVESADDLAQIHELDPARWAATSAPLRDLQCDAAFLAHVDAEHTGRVRAAQIIKARDWLFERLAQRKVLTERVEVIALDTLKGDGPGEKLRAAATRVNREQKVAEPSKITLADVRAFKAGYAKFLANGDGVVPPDVVPEAEVAAFLRDIIAAVGSVKDRGGGDGIDAALLEKFTTQGRAYLDWTGKAKDAAVWGDDTATAAALCAKLDAKLEEYFLHCDLLRQETPADTVLKLKEDELRALRAKDAAAIEAYLTASPLAAPDARGVLRLDGAVNALFRADLADLKAKVLSRALGASVNELTREAWRKARATFAPWSDHEKAKPAGAFDPIGAAKLKTLLDGPLPARVTHYIELDKAAAPELEQVDDVEKLLLYVRWIVDLANNFVNFSTIYRPGGHALVDRGSLVIDGRRLDFCVRVFDRGAHKPVASESLIFLVYAKVMEKEGGGETFEIVAPVTGGEKGRLRVGKRGVFYDNDGKDWDAEILEIVENPISVREAMFAPFRRASKFVSDKVEAWVASKAEAQQQGLSSATESAVTQAQEQAARVGEAPAPPTPPGPPAPPAPSEGLNVNTLILGGGVALAGLGAVLASLFNALTSLSGWLAIFGVVGAVMASSALLAWLKLRKRDVSVLLEASGWAVNVHTNVTARIARRFAYTPDLPKGSSLDATDLLPASDDEGGGGGALFVLLLLVAGAVAAYLHFYKHMF